MLRTTALALLFLPAQSLATPVPWSFADPQPRIGRGVDSSRVGALTMRVESIEDRLLSITNAPNRRIAAGHYLVERIRPDGVVLRARRASCSRLVHCQSPPDTSLGSRWPSWRASMTI